MKNVTKLQKNRDLTKLNISDLLEMSNIVQSYLETHEPDQSKDCKVDVNDRPFDRDTYESQKQLWYSIWVEYFGRPIDEGLEINV